MACRRGFHLALAFHARVHERHVHETRLADEPAAYLADAVSAANANDVLELKDDVTISGSRLKIKKALTIQGATGAEKIICGVPANQLMVLANDDSENYTVTFRNLIVDGQNTVKSIQTFDNNNKAQLKFENVSVVNTTYSVVTGDVKANGREIVLVGNNSFPNGIYLNQGKRVDGKDATHTAPMRITLAGDYEENYAIVLHCENSALYQAVDAAGATGWELYEAMSGTNHELKGRKIARIALNDDADNSSTLTTNNGNKADVVLTRAIPSASFSTFCLPFDLSAEDVATKFNDPELLEYKETLIDGEEATFHFVDAEDGIKAGVPYLIKPSSDISSDITFYGVTIDNTERSVADAHYSFVPLFSKTTTLNSEGATHKYIYLGAADQLYWAAENTTIKGFRAYLQVKSPAAAAVKRFAIGRKDVPTGIENTSAKFGGSQKILRDGQIIIIRDGIEYNLMGQMVK